MQQYQYGSIPNKVDDNISFVACYVFHTYTS